MSTKSDLDSSILVEKKEENGITYHYFTLTNRQGTSVKLLDFGATVAALMVKDKTGQMRDVVVGYDLQKQGILRFMNDTAYFGCIVGRYCNRIAKGKFSLDGKDYSLAINNGENHLHGGIKGFNKAFWKSCVKTGEQDLSVEFTLKSSDGDEGYPGNLDVSVTYTLTKENELKIDYFAKCDQKTIINLTNHMYFNLSGEGKDILSHIMYLNADQFTPVNALLIPVGVNDVTGTPFDFRKPQRIGARIRDSDNQLSFGNGYDHNWILNKPSSEALTLAATAIEETTGIQMDCFTTQPGVQLYTGNFLNGSIVGKNGPIQKHHGFCLETQHFPDSPNHPSFPSVVLSPQQTYRHQTIYKFSITKSS